MKSILVAFLTLATVSANAQGTSSVAVASPKSSNGFVIALSYANLTNVSATSEYKGSYGITNYDSTNSSISGISLAGLRGSYVISVGETMSFDPGLSWMQATDNNRKDSVTTIDGNFNWRFTNSLGLYVGPSVSMFNFNNNSTDLKIDAGLGGQFGLSFQTQKLMIRAGYADYGLSAHQDTNDFKMTARFSGFNSQVGYLF